MIKKNNTGSCIFKDGEERPFPMVIRAVIEISCVSDAAEEGGGSQRPIAMGVKQTNRCPLDGAWTKGLETGVPKYLYLCLTL